MGIPTTIHKYIEYRNSKRLEDGDPDFYKEYPRLKRPDNCNKGAGYNRSETAPALPSEYSPGGPTTVNRKRNTKPVFPTKDTPYPQPGHNYDFQIHPNKAHTTALGSGLNNEEA